MRATSVRRVVTWPAAVLLAAGCGASPAPADDDDDAGRSDAAPRPDAREGDPGTPDAGAGETYAVLTMNLRTALPSDATADERTALVAALIESERPDIVALQEVTESSGMTNRAEALAEATGYAHVFRATHELFIGVEGIAVLARGTITWSDDQELPHVELGVLHRAVLGARATVDGRPIELFATHLSVAGSVTDRADQVATALAFMAAHHEAGVPAFLAGDLNMTADELGVQVLRGEASHDGTTGELADSWTIAEGEAPGFTIPSDDPDRRIDYIFAAPGVPAARDCRTVLGDEVDGVRASDHLGVLCRYAR